VLEHILSYLVEKTGVIYEIHASIFSPFPAYPNAYASMHCRLLRTVCLDTDNSDWDIDCPWSGSQLFTPHDIDLLTSFVPRIGREPNAFIWSFESPGTLESEEPIYAAQFKSESNPMSEALIVWEDYPARNFPARRKGNYCLGMTCYQSTNRAAPKQLQRLKARGLGNGGLIQISSSLFCIVSRLTHPKSGPGAFHLQVIS
jgi:hypothetical protein